MGRGRCRTRLRVGVGVRVRIGFKVSFGRLWCPWSPLTPMGGTFGNWLLAGDPWGGGGGWHPRTRGVGSPVAQQLGKCQAGMEIGCLSGCLDVILRNQLPCVPNPHCHQMVRRAGNLLLLTQCFNHGGNPLQKEVLQMSPFHARNLKYTAMHQQQYLVQPANTQENLNILPSKKIWKMEGNSSLAPPPPPPLTRQGRLLDKGGGGIQRDLPMRLAHWHVHWDLHCSLQRGPRMQWTTRHIMRRTIGCLAASHPFPTP